MKLSEIKLISAYSTTEVDHKKRGRERFPLKEPSAKGSQKGVAGGGGELYALLCLQTKARWKAPFKGPWKESDKAL